MGKYLTSLLILVTLFFPLESFGSEHVRRVQEELRKRHLFYHQLDGNYTPALSHALKRYQAKKGFEPTGIIDSQTAGSLGVDAFASPVPVISVGETNRREWIGPNGESLPAAPLAGDGEDNWFDAGDVGHAYVEHELPYNSSPVQQLNGHPTSVAFPDEEGFVPFAIDLELSNVRLHRSPIVGTQHSLFVAPLMYADWLTSGVAKDRTKRISNQHRARRGTGGARRRKETNPIVLAFQSVDRLMKNLFDDTPQRKKRPPARRG